MSLSSASFVTKMGSTGVDVVYSIYPFLLFFQNATYESESRPGTQKRAFFEATSQSHGTVPKSAGTSCTGERFQAESSCWFQAEVGFRGGK